MDTTTHSLGTRGILNWLLWRWQLDESNPVLIVTEIRQAEKLNGNLRVLLSNTRKAMKNANFDNIVQFGMNTDIVPWQNSNDVLCEALVLTRKTSMRHLILEIMGNKGTSIG